MKTMKKWKLIILTLCLLIIATLIFPATALARGNNVKDTVNEGEVLDQNVVLYGPVRDDGWRDQWRFVSHWD